MNELYHPLYVDPSLPSLVSYQFVVFAGEEAVAPGRHPEAAILRHVASHLDKGQLPALK